MSKRIINFLYAAICHAERVKDFNKTLLELHIIDGDSILFLNTEKFSDYKEEEYILTQREKEQLKLLELDYKEKYHDKGLNNILKFYSDNIDNKIDSVDDNNFEIPGFSDYLEKKDSKRKGIIVKEHRHLLVYCLTNIDWTCNICEKIYSKENMKYYCSLCDYNMCENCHYERKYFMKKSFPKGIKPSNSSVNIHFFKSDLHEHRLVFCRTSRNFTSFKTWKCNECCETFINKIWCFYCTLCNYNLCCKCCGFH